MTDSDIIKALECCTGANAKMCEACHLKKHPDCEYRLQDASLALIKRQQAEIERLTKEHDALIRNYKECAMEVVREFAAKLKERAYVAENEWSHGEHPMVVEMDDIDEALAEMEEGRRT